MVVFGAQTRQLRFLRVFAMDGEHPLHLGTCRGQGLKHRGYHGYRIHNPGEDPQENLCACCDLTCGACRTFARRKLQSLQWTIPLKMPPVDIAYKRKPPPPKRTLHFKPDEGLDCIPLLFFHGFLVHFALQVMKL